MRHARHVPFGSVIRSGLLVTVYGQRKLFHEAMKVKMPTAAKEGRDSGRTMVKKTRQRLAPSMKAAPFRPSLR